MLKNKVFAIVLIFMTSAVHASFLNKIADWFNNAGTKEMEILGESNVTVGRIYEYDVDITNAEMQEWWIQGGIIVGVEGAVVIEDGKTAS